MMNFRSTWKRIEPIVTSTLKKKVLRSQVLYTKEGRMKFKKDIIVTSKLLDRYYVFLGRRNM